MRVSSGVWAAFFLVATGFAHTARADADPALGYVFGSFNLPYRASLSASKPTIIGGDWTTSRGINSRPHALSLEGVGFGAGIGYDGLNVQLDVRSLGDASLGALTFGYRLNLQFGNFEVWTRLAAGPSLAIDYDNLSASRDYTGGIQAVGELGFDYFFWKETMALGIKGAGIPSYTWQATFAIDLDVHVGLRLVL